METKEQNNEKTDSIKITKNSKGYTWEIKVYYNGEETQQDSLKRLETLNKELQNRFEGIQE